MKMTTLKLGTLALALFVFSTIQAQEKKGPNFEKMLEKFDTDKNKTVSLEEFKSVKRKNEISAEKLEKQFAGLDSNSDGEVTLEELEKNWSKGKGKGKKKKD